MKLDTFTTAYINCILWVASLDRHFEISDISSEMLDKIKSDCDKFQEETAKILVGLNLEYVGSDLWFTRNRNGTGFWARDYPKEVCDVLTKSARALGELDIVVGDDGKLYFC